MGLKILLTQPLCVVHETLLPLAHGKGDEGHEGSGSAGGTSQEEGDEGQGDEGHEGEEVKRLMSFVLRARPARSVRVIELFRSGVATLSRWERISGGASTCERE